MRHITRGAAAWLLVLPLLFLGCKKDLEQEDALENIQSVEDNAVAEAEFASVFDYVDMEAPDDFQSGARLTGLLPLPSCAQRTWNAATKTLTLDFGTTNCLCSDGVYRRGKIVAVFNGPRRTVGSTVTISLQDYFVNDRQHTGTKVITNLTAETGKRKYQVVVTGASVVTPEGTISWTANRIVERTAGSGTVPKADDEYTVTGSASGTNRKGVDFTCAITTPLKKVFRVGCLKNFVAGVVTVTNENNKSLTLDYDPVGGEPCDRIAAITVNGRTKQITLR
ncbi:MAG: hypothetical protein ACO1OQ_12940 [Rufibacter sp.]